MSQLILSEILLAQAKKLGVETFIENFVNLQKEILDPEEIICGQPESERKLLQDAYALEFDIFKRNFYKKNAKVFEMNNFTRDLAKLSEFPENELHDTIKQLIICDKHTKREEPIVESSRNIRYKTIISPNDHKKRAKEKFFDDSRDAIAYINNKIARNENRMMTKNIITLINRGYSGFSKNYTIEELL